MPYPTYGLHRCRPDKTLQASHQALQGLLFNKRKRRSYPLHAAYPAGNICRRFRFTLSHQPHQEHFTVFGGHFHVGRFHQVAG